jgi:hypothetical protein
MSSYGLKFLLSNALVGSIEVLEDSPINWDSLNFEYRRDKDLLGIFRRFSTDIEWQGNGYDYIRNIYETQGPEALIEVEVQQRNPATFDFERIFTGRVNLDNYEETLEDGTGLKVIRSNIEEDDFTRRFLNNRKIKVDLFDLVTLDGNAITPYTDEQVANFRLHSVTIPRRHESRSRNDDVDFETVTPGNNFNLANPLFMYGQISLDEDVTDDLDEIFSYQTFITKRDGINNPNVDPISDRRFFLRAADFGDFDIQYDVRCRITITVDADGGSDLFEADVSSFLVKTDSEQNIEFAENLGFTSSGPAVTTFIAIIDETHLRTFTNVEPGDEFYHYISINVRSRRGGGTNLKANARIEVLNDPAPITQNRLQIDATTTFPETNVTGMLMYESLNRVIEKITEKPDGIFSTLFGRQDSEPTSYPFDPNNFGAFNFITNGYGLRQFPLADRSLFTSFRELYNTIRPVFRAAVGVENINGEDKLRIETWQHFYQIENTIFDLGTGVRAFKKTLSNEFRYQTINVGYRNWEAKDSEVAGVDEFNSTRQYRLPINTSDAEFELLTNTITSGYIVELKRREGLEVGVVIEEQPNERYDENLFMISVIENAGIESDWRSRKDEGTTSIQNFVDPDNIMNYKLSPATMLFTWLPWIFGSLYNNADPTVYFAEGTGNYRMTANGFAFVPSGTISENQDWPESELEEPPRWFPEIYSFEAKLTFTQIKAIDQNPNGVIQFIDPIENEQRIGFIQSLEWNGDSRVATFELLRANENFFQS